MGAEPTTLAEAQDEVCRYFCGITPRAHDPVCTLVVEAVEPPRPTLHVVIELAEAEKSAIDTAASLYFGKLMGAQPDPTTPLHAAVAKVVAERMGASR